MPRLKLIRPKVARLLTVKNRLFFGTACMLLPLLIAIAVSLVAFNHLLDDVDELAHEHVQELLPVVSLQAELQEILTLLRDQDNPVDEFLDLDQRIQHIDQLVYTLQGADFDQPGEKNALRELSSSWAAVRGAIETVPQLKQKRQRDQLAKLEEALRGIREQLDIMVYTISDEVDTILARAGETRDRAGLQVGLTLMLALIMASLFGHILAQSILRPLTRLRDGAEHFGKGDFNHRVVIEGRDELGRVAYAFNRMAVRLDRSLRSLRRLSTRDYLTNLLNAREFYRKLDAELERAQRYEEQFSLLMIDADYFKQINDSYGHQSGDRVLRELSRCIRQQVRNVDVPARVGGEEFAVILPNTSGEAALTIAERTRKAIEELEIILADKGKTRLRVTVSIGLATYPRSARDGKELFYQADMALYNAKQGGRNRVSIA